MHPCSHAPTHPSTHPPIHPSTHPPTHPPIHPCIHASIHASMHPCIHASMHPCIHASMHPCIHASMHLCIHSPCLTYLFCLIAYLSYLSICLSVCLSMSVYLSIYLPIYLSIYLATCHVSQRDSFEFVVAPRRFLPIFNQLPLIPTIGSNWSTENQELLHVVGLLVASLSIQIFPKGCPTLGTTQIRLSMLGTAASAGASPCAFTAHAKHPALPSPDNDSAMARKAHLEKPDKSPGSLTSKKP